MKIYIKAYIILLIAALMSACQIPQKSISKLDIAETFIETDPEKAMTLLNEQYRQMRKKQDMHF